MMVEIGSKTVEIQRVEIGHTFVVAFLVRTSFHFPILSTEGTTLLFDADTGRSVQVREERDRTQRVALA